MTENQRKSKNLINQVRDDLIKLEKLVEERSSNDVTGLIFDIRNRLDNVHQFIIEDCMDKIRSTHLP